MKRRPSSDSTTLGLYMSCSVSRPSWWSSLAPHANTTDSIGGLDTHSGTSRQRNPTGESGTSACRPLPALLMVCCGGGGAGAVDDDMGSWWFVTGVCARGRSGDTG